VVAAARTAGLSPEIAEPVWRTLIERSIAHEFAAFDEKPA
jgi:isochorismate pyruvate lyase